MSFSIIAAMDETQGIGVDNRMPWSLKSEIKHFAEATRGGTVIMGRRTWESLPEKHRPLKDRKNIVVTHQVDYAVPGSVVLADSLDEALSNAEGKTFVIGGATLFEEAINHPDCKELILTEVYGQFDCDTFFPEIPKRFKIKFAGPLLEEDGIDFRVFDYLAD